MADQSKSRFALEVALRGAQQAGAQVELFDVRELSLPMYDPDLANDPPQVALALCEAVFAAQGMIWSSPLYHGTVSGAFKNAVDWLDLLRNREPAFLTDKVIGLIATAGGMQGLQAINTMEFAVRALRAFAVPLVIPLAQAWKSFDQEGHPTDPAIERQLLTLGGEVARASAQMAAEGVCDYSNAVRQSLD
jgi:FMN reductase